MLELLGVYQDRVNVVPGLIVLHVFQQASAKQQAVQLRIEILLIGMKEKKRLPVCDNFHNCQQSQPGLHVQADLFFEFCTPEATKWKELSLRIDKCKEYCYNSGTKFCQRR